MRFQRLVLIFAALGAALLLLSAFVSGVRATAAADTPPQPQAPLAGLTAGPTAGERSVLGQGYWVLANMQEIDTDCDPECDEENYLAVINSANDAAYYPLMREGGVLGTSGGGIFDVAVTPDGQTALISNFGDSTIHVVDFSNPVSPSAVNTITIPFFAEDMDITPDGRYALVTDGGYTSRLAVIDILAQTLVYTAELNQYDEYGDPIGQERNANAVAVAPDNTIIVADYFGAALHTLLFDAGRVITEGNTYTYTLHNRDPYDPIFSPGWPVNVSIAPDGQTVMVSTPKTTTVMVYQIVAPGVLEKRPRVVAPGIEDLVLSEEYNDGYRDPSVQSIAFNEAGDKAYLMINNVYSGTEAEQQLYNRVAEVDILAPGVAQYQPGHWAAVPLFRSGSQLFGVDTVTVAGNKAYVGSPTLSGAYITTTNAVGVVDLQNFTAYTVALGTADYRTRYEYRTQWPAGVTSVSYHLGMKKTVNDTNPTPGDIVTYTLVLTADKSPIRAVSVADLLPVNAVLAGAVQINPADAGTAGTSLADLVHDLQVKIDRPVTITYAVKLPLGISGGGVVTNTATASSLDLAVPALAQRGMIARNIAPILNPLSNRQVTMNTPLQFTASASDVYNNDYLRYTLDDGAPAGMSIDPDTGLFTWTPSTPGTYTVTVRVTDNGILPLSDFQVVTIGVNNYRTFMPLLAR